MTFALSRVCRRLQQNCILGLVYGGAKSYSLLSEQLRRSKKCFLDANFKSINVYFVYFKNNCDFEVVRPTITEEQKVLNICNLASEEIVTVPGIAGYLKGAFGPK